MDTQRTCYALDLKDNPDLIAEYEHHHKPENIWPEIPEGIRAGGIADMQIYRIDTRLFMIIETRQGVDPEDAFAMIEKTPRQSEWGAFMQIFQQRLGMAEPNQYWVKMKPVFSLAACLK